MASLNDEVDDLESENAALQDDLEAVCNEFEDANRPQECP